MSLVKKEARLSGMLLARKGSALPAHTDHRLTVHAVEPVQNKKDLQKVGKERENRSDIVPAETDTGMLVEAVKEINNVTKRQYNEIIDEIEQVPEPKVEAKIEPALETKIATPIIGADVTPTKNVKPGTKRIAMTLRMEQADHLKLRLYAAHSRKSCQEIISEALGMFLSKDEKVCGLSDCNCLANK